MMVMMTPSFLIVESNVLNRKLVAHNLEISQHHQAAAAATGDQHSSRQQQAGEELQVDVRSHINAIKVEQFHS
jgi:hypothetical protein